MNQQIKKVSILILVALFLSIGFSYGITWSTGFEGEGALDGWIIKGNVATKDIEEIFANTNTWTIDSNENLMVALTPKESSGTYNDMVGDLSLSEESKSYITGLFSNITNVTYMYKDIILSEGEEFSVAWNYVATDYKPFNDSSLVTLVNLEDSSNPAIINGHYSEVCILGSTVEGTGNYTTGDYGSTGWQIVEFKAIEQGSYRIGFAVYNLADTINDPYLYLDDALGITKQNNEVFEPVERDENAPSPPGNFALLFTEDTLQEAEVNDGSISNSLQIELTVDAFTGSIGDFITDYEITGLPLGLTSSITKTEDKKAELTISGNANKHNEKDSIDNLVVSFKDEAFVGNNALAITNADNTVLNINYIDFENTITFPQPEAKTYGDEHFKLTATSDSNNKVQYSS